MVILRNLIFYQSKQIIRLITHQNVFKRSYSEKLLPATDFFTWNTANTVKLRMEDSAPGNYPPISVQTMMRNTVSEYGNKTALVSFDGKINFTYQEYYDQVLATAKGIHAFLSLR